MLNSSEEPSCVCLEYGLFDPLFDVCKKPTISTTSTLFSWAGVGRSPPLKIWGEAYVPDFFVPCESCDH